MPASKTQIDRLGERLKAGAPTEADLRMRDDYRRSFGGVYSSVVGIIRDRLNLEPTGRPAKSTASIVDKLRRESFRLSQIQDIAGCRLIVRDTIQQDQVVGPLVQTLPGCTVVDRRRKPSHGYRAVHVIVDYGGALVEIQVRTEMQHLWAEMSEKMSDVLDSSLKYGGGDPKFRDTLQRTSTVAGVLEELEQALAKLPLDYATKAVVQTTILGVRETYESALRLFMEGLDRKEESE